MLPQQMHEKAHVRQEEPNDIAKLIKAIVDLEKNGGILVLGQGLGKRVGGSSSSRGRMSSVFCPHYATDTIP